MSGVVRVYQHSSHMHTTYYTTTCALLLTAPLSFSQPANFPPALHFGVDLTLMLAFKPQNTYVTQNPT